MRSNLALLRTRSVPPARAPILRYGVAILSTALALIPALISILGYSSTKELLGRHQPQAVRFWWRALRAFVIILLFTGTSCSTTTSTGARRPIIPTFPKEALWPKTVE